MSARQLLPILLLALAPAGLWAHDFSAVAPTGQTLYYNYVDGGVELTYPVSTSVPTQGWLGYTSPTGALVVPSSVSVGDTQYAVVSIYRFALYGCYGLTSLTLQDGIAEIGISAFSGCSGLTTVTLPPSIGQIGNNAFLNDSSIRTLTCYAAAPPPVGNNTFSGMALDSCVLQVPCLSMAAYGASPQWGQFGQVVSAGCTANLSVAANNAARGSVSGGGSYAVGTTVTVMAQAADGCFFACWSDGDTLNPRLVTLTGDLSLTAFFFAVRHDTITIHDTLTVHEPVQPTYFQLQVTAQGQGIGVGSATLPAGSVVEIAALPLEGARFSHWNDGEMQNPRHVTLTDNITYTAYFEAAGIAGTPAGDWRLWSDGDVLTVECQRGERVRVFTVDGRMLACRTCESGIMHLRIDAAGTYLVQVGNAPARKTTITQH